MPSQKSTSSPSSGRAPQRERGKLRVAALLRAGAAIFARKGFDAATMTEIAALAGAPIGSLYQFFPSKEALADALLAHYGELAEARLGDIAGRASGFSARGLANALIDLMLELKDERAAAVALFNSGRGLSLRPLELRDAMREHIARILMLKDPHLPEALARSMAVVLLQNMKAVAALQSEEDGGSKLNGVAELRDMTAAYLASKLEA